MPASASLRVSVPEADEVTVDVPDMAVPLLSLNVATMHGQLCAVDMVQVNVTAVVAEVMLCADWPVLMAPFCWVSSVQPAPGALYVSPVAWVPVTPMASSAAWARVAVAPEETEAALPVAEAVVSSGEPAMPVTS